MKITVTIECDTVDDLRTLLAVLEKKPVTPPSPPKSEIPKKDNPLVKGRHADD